MKNLATAFALGTALLVGVQLNATPVAPQEDAPQAQPQQTAPSDAEKATVFTGKVMESKGQLVLMDESTKTTYALDDQDKAKAFKGKAVKVTGTLEATSNTIHIANIEAA